MRIIVLVGSSGTGKSYHAISLAREKIIEYIIDDGLLIKGNKVLGGTSAKRERSKMAAVKRALFINPSHRDEIKNIINRENPEGILILGTSDKMVESIVRTLDLGDITEKVYIEDYISNDEIKIARRYRTREGKHVIPVPTFEIKKDFSGYFLNPLKVLRKLGIGEVQELHEKSVVRPTFSYMGKYTISDRVIRELIFYVSNKAIGIKKISNIDIKSYPEGIEIEIEVVAVYGNPIKTLIEGVQSQVRYEIEEMTSLNILSVNIFVKNLYIHE
ncbi:Asp23/Gls24 family envelope stress response protein [Alkaliphilus peptidifermentans]|uniref:Asp23 family, cell envelope-related function n=1 Tax=Alkaliphilus peptidifermentans DSM 18978 TaxID=1120976 RepID=A0A1G5IC11_9FIRM|nr:Asp23/Gls24 family envelope stress response protein [Alkaliphilus peptidifermentans]SCY73675.1 Asp23 family, cell envelope-related function [Alkaliphilus peptidifermentans DSM 18978]